MKGACLCRRVSVELASAPGHVNICNCKLCRGLGAAWGHLPGTDVTISGDTRPFRRDDIGDPWIETHFCTHCGTTTHYLPTERWDTDTIVVNMRIFDVDDIRGIAARFLDGRAVSSDEDEFACIATGYIGEGTAF